MNNYTYDYVTRGGYVIEIEIPAWHGAQYLSDSERRRLRAWKAQVRETQDRDNRIGITHVTTH